MSDPAARLALRCGLVACLLYMVRATLSGCAAAPLAAPCRVCLH
jgi:hypothetical protein